MESIEPLVSIIILKNRENENISHCLQSMNVVQNSNRFEFNEDKKVIDDVCGIHVNVKECTIKTLLSTLLECETRYICLVKSNVLVEENFLTEMLFHYENIKNTGIVYLLEDMKGHEITPMPNNDDEFSPLLLGINSGAIQRDIFFFRTYVVHELENRDCDSIIDNIFKYCVNNGQFIYSITSSFILKK
jgi:hypothetical protein